MSLRHCPAWFSACLVPVCPPGIHERSIFVSGVFPRKVAAVDQVKFAVRQSFVEILGIDGRDDQVSAASNDLHRCLYLRQDISEYFKLRRVGLHVTDRLSESIAFVRSQTVLASGVAER